MQFFSLVFLLCFVAFLVLFGLFLLFIDADITLFLYHKYGKKKDFQNQVIWITGASSGIGEFLAYSLAKSNAKLVLSGTNVQRLENVKKNCIEKFHFKDDDVLLVPFPIEKFELHSECVRQVLDYFGKIDILVNNAGLSQRADFPDIDINVDQNLFNINVFGPVNLTRLVLKHFLEVGKGHVVISSSVAGKLGAPYSSTYTGSKHALHGYFECLRSEMHEKNINVTLVCPGPVFSLLTDRCVTGKTGETYDHTQRPTDKKMATDRCAELMLTAMSYKLDECWISIQPILLIFYIAQYMPSFFRNVLVKLVFTRERVMKLRQGQ